MAIQEAAISPKSNERTSSILRALRGLSPADLAAAAAAAPQPLAGHLAGLAAVLSAPDPAAALAALLDPLTADAATLQQQLDRAGSQLQAQLGGLSAALAALAEPLDGLTLPDALPEDLLENLDDPALSAILTEALQLSGGADLAAKARAAIAEGAALTGELAGMLEAARRDPEAAAGGQAIQARIDRLTATLAELEAAGQALPDALSLLDRLRRLAEQQHHPVAVDIAIAQAALWDARGDQPPQSLQQRWREALDLALRHQNLPAAQQAAQRTQLLALSRSQPLPAATAAAEVATLARSLDVRRAEVLALLEESLILAGVHERRDDALRRLRAALARAEGHPDLAARVRLSAGQTLERLGEHAEARRAWRDLLRQPDSAAAFPAEAGRAMLYLGRQEARQGRAEAARTHLTGARDIGRSTGDWLLYAPALIALLEDRVRVDDVLGAGALIREARALAPRGGPGATAALEEMVSYLRGRWGAEILDAALA
jgi:hypothetical protein